MDGCLSAILNLVNLFGSADEALTDYGHQRRQEDRQEAMLATLQEYGINSREEGLESASRAMQREDYQAAAVLYGRILAVYVLDVEVLYGRAFAYFKLGEYLAALQDLNTVLQVAPGGFHNYTLRAEIHLKLNNPAAALEDMNWIFSSGRVSPDAYVMRAFAYAHLNRLPDAFSNIDHVFDVTPAPAPGLYNQRGWLYALAGNYPRALQDLNQALELDPDYVDGYGSRGHTYFLMGSYAEALADFVKSTELKPNHTFAIAGQAVTQHALGSIDEAKILWRNLIDLNRRYKNVDALVQDWHPAEAFVDAARKLVAELHQATS